MTPLRVAVLEDSQVFLNELVDNLRRTDLVDVIFYEKASEPFIKLVREKQPEALLLDIHLKDENIDGVQIAAILKLPVLFLSAERRNYLESIDNLKLLGTFPVEEIGKTPDTDKLKSILKVFIPRVREYQKRIRVKIKPKGEDEIYINPSDVMFIETIKESGNHQFNFVSRKPITVADRSFDIFKENGFPQDKFYRFGKSYLFNISSTNYVDGYLKTTYINTLGNKDTLEVSVPPNKNKEVKNTFLK